MELPRWLKKSNYSPGKPYRCCWGTYRVVLLLQNYISVIHSSLKNKPKLLPDIQDFLTQVPSSLLKRALDIFLPYFTYLLSVLSVGCKRVVQYLFTEQRMHSLWLQSPKDSNNLSWQETKGCKTFTEISQPLLQLLDCPPEWWACWTPPQLCENTVKYTVRTSKHEEGNGTSFQKQAAIMISG